MSNSVVAVEDRISDAVRRRVWRGMRRRVSEWSHASIVARRLKLLPNNLGNTEIYAVLRGNWVQGMSLAGGRVQEAWWFCLWFNRGDSK